MTTEYIIVMSLSKSMHLAQVLESSNVKYLRLRVDLNTVVSLITSTQSGRNCTKDFFQ